MKNLRNFAVMGMGLILSVTLAACSPGGRTLDDTSSSQSSASSTSPNLNQEQVERILSSVQEVIDQAESENDPEMLASRLTNPALSMRQGQMERAELTGEDLEDLTLSMKVFSSTVGDAWPRTLVVGTEASGDTPAVIYVFTQSDAQSDYMLENWVRLIGGNSVTGLSVQSGSQSLSDDATGYLRTPSETLSTFINLLNDPENEAYQIFNDSTLSTRVSEELTTLNEALESVGEVTLEATVADYPLTAVTLTSGEALVSGGFTYTNVYQRTVANSAMQVGGTAASYLDDPTVVGTVTVTYTVNVLFTVPAEGSGQTTINVVGAERVIQSVESDDSTSPD